MNCFTVKTTDNNSRARRGTLSTAHGDVQTPTFMPVGTRGSVKGLTPQHLRNTRSEMILANAYHLMLRPGAEAVRGLGGLHSLMAWDGPILTDSGGYQVFSLSTLNRVGEDGVEFASHVDGARIYLDAETAIRAQNALGADVIMCFDECTPYPCEPDRLEKAVQRTIRWARKCKAVHASDRQLLFAIVQGGVNRDLRARCAEELVAMDFDGYAIGGLSVGEGHDLMVATVEHTAPLLPADRPRYLMGVGMPADIIAAVRAGVDMFDCVLPTRNGRNAFAFTADGALRLRNTAHADDTAPVEIDCPCYCCANFSRGTIRHLFNVGEMLGPILLSIHNITYYQRLMADIRRHIEAGDFEPWAAQAIARLQAQSGNCRL
ncbi:MAG TPA: tRNA guanosine(34) transglycosylase Tgt [Anaerohalosphaeraceae bacterium]|jgi:queuine tRNA-ribosyltransferase|nr:tRNA guanosine(34) transglycosylase Tgt [Anaerohalosphaeraceae bacterium]HRT52153.1 tRNA guanosine(34) transglycosylase Tgt [Anaerohalosphaeraceae bacterium]HRT86634.1 tRNA guanosine(34) transglycosylase Tgt [Anaerohalosphaeraceae bacterium]